MTDTTLPQSKEEMMAAIRREWDALMDLVSRLSSAQMHAPDEGGWTPKDNLAHLTEWMKVLLGHHIDRRPAPEVMGLPSDVTKGWDMERINPVLLERNRGRTAEDVLSELERVYAEVTSRLESMSWEDLMRPRHEKDPDRTPLLVWVLGDTSEHFEEHRLTIERSLDT
jgi:hypothetical protein